MSGPSESRPKTKRRFLIRFLILGIVGYLASSFWLSSILLALPERVLVPDAGLVRTGRALANSLVISIWSGEPDGPSKGCVLLFHSRGGAHPQERMLWLQSLGYTVVAPDFRGHGASAGETTTFGWLEQEEVRQTIALARNLYPDLPLAAWGTSMGAAALLFATPEISALNGVILESTYSSLERAFRNRFDQQFPSALFPLTKGPIGLAEWRAGFRLDQIQPVHQLQYLRPEQVLLVRGEWDERVQADEHADLLAALPGASGIILKGVGHDGFFESGGLAYRKQIQKTLERYLVPR